MLNILAKLNYWIYYYVNNFMFLFKFMNFYILLINNFLLLVLLIYVEFYFDFQNYLSLLCLFQIFFIIV